MERSQIHQKAATAIKNWSGVIVMIYFCNELLVISHFDLLLSSEVFVGLWALISAVLC